MNELWKNTSIDIKKCCVPEKSTGVSMLTSYPCLILVQNSWASSVNTPLVNELPVPTASCVAKWAY